MLLTLSINGLPFVFGWFFLFAALVIVHAVTQSLHLVHMLQLSGYHNDVYARWCNEHMAKILSPGRLFCLVTLLLLALRSVLFEAVPALAFLLVACVGLFVSLLDTLPRQAKKPLVFTKRVWRLLITFAILLAAYVLLWEHLVGFSSYWKMSVGAAILLLIVPLLVPLANLINAPIEKAVANWYVKDAKRILAEHPDLTVIGITGSYGKTSTKNFLYGMLSAQYNTLMTPESYNTTMGVVRTIRERLKPSHEVFIVEMGAKGLGEIKEICDIVHPQYGLLTSIGEQHLESFGSVENIVKTKFELYDAIPENGFICVNADNDLICAELEARKGDGKEVVTYGVKDESAADYRATDGTVSGAGCRFTLIEPNGNKTAFGTKLLGGHNVQNITGCLALAAKLGVPAEKLVYAVRLLKPVRHRLELLPNGFIDDAFNSNPAGFRSALETLKAFSGQRVLVTPGMVELGEREAALNEELGAYAADCCDLAVLVGERQAPPLKKGLLSAGFDEGNIYVAKSLADGLEFLKTVPANGPRTVLLENDLPDNYD